MIRKGLIIVGLNLDKFLSEFPYVATSTFSLIVNKQRIKMIWSSSFSSIDHSERGVFSYRVEGNVVCKDGVGYYQVPVVSVLSGDLPNDLGESDVDSFTDTVSLRTIGSNKLKIDFKLITNILHKIRSEIGAVIS